MSFETHPLLRDERLEPHEIEAIRIAWRVRRGLPPRLRVEGEDDIEPGEALDILGEIRERQKVLEGLAKRVALSRYPAAKQFADRSRNFVIIFGLIGVLLLAVALASMVFGGR